VYVGCVCVCVCVCVYERDIQGDKRGGGNTSTTTDLMAWHLLFIVNLSNTPAIPIRSRLPTPSAHAHVDNESLLSI